LPPAGYALAGIFPAKNEDMLVGKLFTNGIFYCAAYCGKQTPVYPHLAGVAVAYGGTVLYFARHVSYSFK
jgi:hypothetical protein